MGAKLGAMARSIWKRYRWDRIALVTGVLGVGVCSLVAWVSPEESAEELVLAHPTSQAHIEPAGALPASAQGATAEPAAPVVPKPQPARDIAPCSCNSKVLNIPRNPYTAHQQSARNLPNSFFIKDKGNLTWGQKVGKLVPVEDGRGYHIAPLSHSHKLLLPEARAVLKEMGNRFADELKGTSSEGARFRVSSMTRTDVQQNALSRRNYNAWDGQSTHSYGASFDIAFTDRPTDKVDCSASTRAIQKVLREFQDQGRVLIVPEGTCMHVTVRP